jgi:hypothetical protein
MTGPIPEWFDEWVEIKYGGGFKLKEGAPDWVKKKFKEWYDRVTGVHITIDRGDK